MHQAFSVLARLPRSTVIAAMFAVVFSGGSRAQEAPVPPKSDTSADAGSSSSGLPVPGAASSGVTPGNQPTNPGRKNQTQPNNPGTITKPAQTQGTAKNRLFFLLPNFLTVEDVGKVPPLTPAEKFKLVARCSFDYMNFVWYGVLAGINQANNTDVGYGQGMQGYGKRYGAAFGDSTIENFLTGAILPSVLHQDPRYYQLGKGSFWHRTGYAVSRIFVTRTDNGVNQFNYSEVFGSAAAAGISTYSYHPRDERNISNVASVWGTQVGLDTLTIVLREFWPDIRRKLHGSKPAAAH